MALAVVVAVLLGAPLMYLGIQTATRDPALNSLAALPVPAWAAESPEDRIISGSRWCLIDCRFWERRLVSQGNPVQTNEVYQRALLQTGWQPWEVAGCPLVDVDGFYSCWRRDEYTLDLWVHPPACAYDPLHLRRNLTGDAGSPDDDCTGSEVEIKMQHRVADERGLGGEFPGAPPGTPAPPPTGTPSPSPDGSPSPDPSGS